MKRSTGIGGQDSVVEVDHDDFSLALRLLLTRPSGLCHDSGDLGPSL